jgi:hypothetical protein
VAFRIARHLKNGAARQFPVEAAPAQQSADDPGLQAAWRELCALLDQEVQSLSEHYRAPLVLCYLEGQTRDRAARQLGWSLRTLDRRLTRGRELLRLRLLRRGLTLSAGLLAVAMSEQATSAAVSRTLLQATIRAAMLAAEGKLITIAASGRVAVLVQEGLRVMLWTKLQTVVCLAIVAVGLTGTGALLLARAAPAVDNYAVPEDPPPAANLAATEFDQQQATPTAGRPVDRMQTAQERIQSVNNLKQLALAMIQYTDTYRHLPAPAVYAGKQEGGDGLNFVGPSGPGGAGGGSAAGPAGAPGVGGGGPPPAALKGRALLSWRVMLLPYLEQDHLFKQFKLDEPWNSPHNMQLQAKMPDIYAPVGDLRKQYPTSTFYQVFVGPGAGFEKHRALHYADITDGTSNTIMIAEAGRPVPWTKPEDLAFDADEPLPELGGVFKDVFNVAFFDGSVHTFKKDADEATLRTAITRNGGEVTNFERLSATPPGGSGNSRRLGLTRENHELKDQSEALRQIVEKYRVELKAAQENADVDMETVKLRAENRRLKDEIQQLKLEADSLAEQLRKLKPTTPTRP